MKSGVQHRGHLLRSQLGHWIWPYCAPWTASLSDALQGEVDGSKSKLKAAWGDHTRPADSVLPSMRCWERQGTSHQARPTLETLPPAKGHLYRAPAALPGAHSRIPIWPGSPGNRPRSAPQRPPQPGSRPRGAPHLSGTLSPLGARWGWPRDPARGATRKLGARGQALPSPFRASSQAASDYWCAPPSVREDGEDAVPSGRPNALAAVTSRPVPRFRCGSLVSPLGAGSLHLRRRGSRPAGGALRAGGRLGWRQPLSLWFYLGDGKKAASSPPWRAGTTPGTNCQTSGPAGKCSSAPNSQWETTRRGGWGGAGPRLDRKRIAFGTGRFTEAAAVSAAASGVGYRTAEVASGWF